MVNLLDVIQACQHLTLDPGEDTPDVIADDGAIELPDDSNQEDDHSPADLLSYVTNRQSNDSIPPAHLAKMMSDTINRHSRNGSDKPGPNTRKVNTCVFE
jgi:hypothetical protein